MKEKIYRAGLIPYCVTADGEIMMLFMKPSDSHYGGPDYQIAKGRIEKNDVSTEYAAVREAEEELGLKKNNLKFTHELGVYLGRTTFFVGEVNDMNNFNETDTETESTEWMSYRDFYERGRNLHLPVVQDAFEYINSLTQDDY